MRSTMRFAEANFIKAMPVNWDQGNLLELSKQKWINKSILLLVTLFIFTSVNLKAQSPQKINFQSIVRNTSGVIVSNKSVNFKITILSGTITGTPVYSETHLKTTDAIGLVSLQIGTGTVASGVFSSIDWGNALHFIKLEADFSGGNTYVTLGTQELMSVPYAMYASKTDTNSLNLTNRFAEKSPVYNPTFTGTVSGIDKTMVGLGSVDNTSDASKPVSTATQAALDLKAPLASPTFTGTVSGIDKTMVGLENVDNTTDLSKPVSTATQAELATKVNILDTMSMLSNYLRKAEFPSGSNLGEFMYWNGSKWVSLSPGTTGQSIIMSSTGTPTWGCIITNSAGTPSSSPTLPVNTVLTDITIATTGATGIGTATGLPAGVTAIWSANVITISGTPTNIGTFNYTIPLTGGCGTASATGTITVSACPTTTITYNSDTYTTVGIGTQCWMAENLRTRKYNDGTEIRFDNSGGSGGTTGQTWAGAGLNYGAYTIYAHDSTATTGNLAIYGYLYNWYAAAGIITDGGLTTKSICPPDWHLPTYHECSTLRDFLGGSNVAGGKMKSTGTTYWNIPNSAATNESGFSGLPGGTRFGSGSFGFIRDFGSFWGVNEGGSDATRLALNYSSGIVDIGFEAKSRGFSVRCVMD